jgi:hypothetical protein
MAEGASKHPVATSRAPIPSVNIFNKFCLKVRIRRKHQKLAQFFAFGPHQDNNDNNLNPVQQVTVSSARSCLAGIFFFPSLFYRVLICQQVVSTQSANMSSVDNLSTIYDAHHLTEPTRADDAAIQPPSSSPDRPVYPQNQCKFLSLLPLEIRNEIYKLLVVNPALGECVVEGTAGLVNRPASYGKQILHTSRVFILLLVDVVFE